MGVQTGCTGGALGGVERGWTDTRGSLRYAPLVPSPKVDGHAPQESRREGGGSQ